MPHRNYAEELFRRLCLQRAEMPSFMGFPEKGVYILVQDALATSLESITKFGSVSQIPMV